MKIALEQQGRFLTAELDGSVTCNRVAQGPWEIWTVEPHPDGGSALRAWNGKYLCAELGGGEMVNANRDRAGAWEHFAFDHGDEGTVLLRTVNGAVVCAGPGPDYRVVSRAQVQDRGWFTVVVVEPDAAPASPGAQTAPAGPLTPLRRERFHFANAAGRWFGIGATCFLAYFRFLTEGPDAIRPVLAQLQALGFNLIRVFGMVDSFAHWYPQEHADYYTRIPEFLELCAEYGLYVLWDGFADTRRVMPDAAQQIAHWTRTCEALRARSNAIVSKGNELNQHDNAVDATLSKPDGLLSCSGSFGGQPAANPPMPLEDWDFGCFHVRRDYPKTIPDATVVQLRTGDTVDGRAHPMPIGQDEPPGFGEEAGPHGRWTDPDRAYELAGTAKGTAAFVVYHCDAGVLAQVFGPNQTACASAFVAGAR